jgi:multicomponent K+:H+ antiporter subunit G
MDWFVEALVSLLLLVGAGFALLGAFGLVKLPDFHTRLHAPTKATTLGVGSILVASMVYFSYGHDGTSLHELLVTAFLFATAPTSAHLLSKAALHRGCDTVSRNPPPRES